MSDSSEIHNLQKELSNRKHINSYIPKKVLKIIIVGDSSVGKTCLTYRFCQRKFLEKADATIGVDFHEKTVKIGEEDVKLQLWDTAGQERFRKSMVPHYYRNVHAVVIVYDITKINSFNSVEGWVAECAAQGMDNDIPRVLVGTQCDRGNNRVVKTSTAQRLADHHGMPLFETSAQLDSEIDTVDAIFMTLAHKLHNQRPFRVTSLEQAPEKKILKLSMRRNRSAKASTDVCGCL